MEESTLDNSATPAKYPYQLPRDEFLAHIEAEIASARCGPAPVRCDPGDDDDELVEPAAPVPEPQRRQRKRSLTKVCEAARKAGADRVIVDGVVIAFSPSAAVPESVSLTDSTNEWDAVLPGVDHGPH
jgi:hypothetical protein